MSRGRQTIRQSLELSLGFLTHSEEKDAAAGRVRSPSKKPALPPPPVLLLLLFGQEIIEESFGRSVGVPLLEKSEEREKKGRKETAAAAANRHLAEGANDLHVGGAGRSIDADDRSSPVV